MTQFDCGDGYICEDGFCVEIPDDGNADKDSSKDNVLPEGTETAVETEELPEIEGTPDELIDTMVDETPDQNDTVVEPDIDETTDDLLDTMTETEDTDAVDTAIDEDSVDEDIVDEDTVDIQPDLDLYVSDDDVAPTVTSTLPADNATGVAVTAKVEIHFSEALNTGSIGGNFTIMQGATNILFSSMWRGVDNTVILTPNASLAAGLVYEVTVKTGVADPAGNPLAAQYVFDFTTSACGNSVTDSGIGEVCDDGVNDGAYDGCMPGCMAHAPYCGDGILTAGSEVCDTALSVACNELGQGYANSDIAVCSIGCQGLETDVCVCASGYEKNGGGACVDIKECDTANGGCAENCIETEGSHACSCNSGYTLNADGHACDDNDECIANPCDDNGDGGGSCTNSAGSYSCACSFGFEEKLGSCHDIDECTLDTDGCAQNCQNTSGGHTCSCASGYTLNGDGHTCDNIDECTVNTNPCDNSGDAAATCSDATPGYTCNCSGGYVESGGTCILDNPCGSGWIHNSSTGKCYQYVSAAANWPDAQSGCAGLGGRLVDISDATENQYVANLMPDGTHVWIGLSDYPTAVTANGANPSCGTPEPVAGRGGVYYGTTSSNHIDEDCGVGAMPGYDEYFRVTTLAGYNGTWTFKVYPVSASHDFSLTIDSNCISYLSCNDGGGNGSIETLTYNLSASSVYYVYVDSWSTSARDYYIEFLPPSGKLPALPSGQLRSFNWDGNYITYDNTAFVNFLTAEPNFNTPGSGSDSKYREVRCIGQQRYGGAANGATWYDDPCSLTKPYICEK